MRQYALITASYWGFTLTDGALRMLVVLYFHQLGYSPLAIASLFLFYEFFGVVTNLLGGWLAAVAGLARTLLLGLMLQIAALSMLLVDVQSLTVLWVMAAQALSGIAKDLTKMSAKSGVKTLVPDAQQGRLYRWVAALTGSKNALKGIGFFLGGFLLHTVGFAGAVLAMALFLGAVVICALLLLDRSLGKASFKPKFTDLLSKSRAINVLSAARLFLFGARDVWFVVALPVFLQLEHAWSAVEVGTLLAIWVMGYGVVQSLTPRLTGLGGVDEAAGSTAVGAGSVVRWGLALALVMCALLAALWIGSTAVAADRVVVAGLLMFGVVFALNSALHSYLIVSYANEDGVSLDVGFYYMANAMGRLVGTLLSGLVYQLAGLTACLLVSLLLILAATGVSLRLPHRGAAPRAS